jgi:hypothetical protein
MALLLSYAGQSGGSPACENVDVVQGLHPRVLIKAVVALLKSLTPKQWKACGMHKERGPETMETVAKMFAGHDLNHFQQIERILTSPAK